MSTHRIHRLLDMAKELAMWKRPTRASRPGSKGEDWEVLHPGGCKPGQGRDVSP